jgi:hypothetical protein
MTNFSVVLSTLTQLTDMGNLIPQKHMLKLLNEAQQTRKRTSDNLDDDAPRKKTTMTEDDKDLPPKAKGKAAIPDDDDDDNDDDDDDDDDEEDEDFDLPPKASFVAVATPKTKAKAAAAATPKTKAKAVAPVAPLPIAILKDRNATVPIRIQGNTFLYDIRRDPAIAKNLAAPIPLFSRDFGHYIGTFLRSEQLWTHQI